jgi:hypothetical protein
MTEIDFAYFNFEHGGLIDGRDHFFSSGRGYDFGGLVRVAGGGDRPQPAAGLQPRAVIRRAMSTGARYFAFRVRLL